MKFVIYVRFRGLWFRRFRVPESIKPWLRSWIWQSPCRGVRLNIFGKRLQLLSRPVFEGIPTDIDGNA